MFEKPLRQKHAPCLHAALPAIMGSSTFFIYTLIALVGHRFLSQSSTPYYVYLASGWLHHSWWLTSLPPASTAYTDLTFWHGHIYVAFPPLPAVLLLPFVSLWGGHLWDVPLSIICGAVDSMLMVMVLQSLRTFWDVQISTPTIMALTLLLSIGSPLIWIAPSGSVWYFAGVVGVGAVLLGLWAALQQPAHPILVGVCFGLAGMARPDTWAAIVIYLVLVTRTGYQSKRWTWIGRQCAVSMGALSIFPLLTLGYNKVRFGSFSDVGYATMNVGTSLKPILHTYGQFNIHFLLRDIYYMFLAPPLYHAGGIYPNLTGTGIFWATPALLFGGFSLVSARGHHRDLMLALLIGIGVISIPLCLYFNTGALQFGSRFSVDFLPCSIVLIALGVQNRRPVLSLLFGCLVSLSVAINIWGHITCTHILITTHLFCRPAKRVQL